MAIQDAVLDNVSIGDALRLVGVHVSGERFSRQIRCPFHDDERPSARVYPDTGTVYCFTCRKAWDVIGLVAQFNGCSRSDAVEILVRVFGIEYSDDDYEARFQNMLQGPEPEESRNGYERFLLSVTLAAADIMETWTDDMRSAAWDRLDIIVAGKGYAEAMEDLRTWLLSVSG